MKKRPKCKGLAVAIKTQSLSRWIKVFLSMDSDLRHNKCFFREKKTQYPREKIFCFEGDDDKPNIQIIQMIGNLPR